MKYNVLSASSLSKRVEISTADLTNIELEDLLSNFVVDKEAFREYCNSLFENCVLVISSRRYLQTDRKAIADTPMYFLQTKPTNTKMKEI